MRLGTSNYSPKFILIEGPDGGGKSTLVENLKNALKWDSKSLHHRECDQFERYLCEYACADHIIFDRGHISEKVYSQIWRGGDPFSKDERQLLDKLCMLRGVVVYVDPPIKILRARHCEKKELHKIKERDWQASVEYFFAEMNDIPHLRYAGVDWDDLHRMVKAIAERVGVPHNNG